MFKGLLSRLATSGDDDGGEQSLAQRLGDVELGVLKRVVGKQDLVQKQLSKVEMNRKEFQVNVSMLLCLELNPGFVE